jgi:hypothetical protein
MDTLIDQPPPCPDGTPATQDMRVWRKLSAEMAQMPTRDAHPPRSATAFVPVLLASRRSFGNIRRPRQRRPRRRPGERSQTRGVALREGAALPRLSRQQSRAAARAAVQLAVASGVRAPIAPPVVSSDCMQGLIRLPGGVAGFRSSRGALVLPASPGDRDRMLSGRGRSLDQE